MKIIPYVGQVWDDAGAQSRLVQIHVRSVVPSIRRKCGTSVLDAAAVSVCVNLLRNDPFQFKGEILAVDLTKAYMKTDKSTLSST